MALLALLACTIPVIPDVQAQPARACAPDTPLDGPIARASARFALPDALIRAVIAVESNFMVYAVSPKGARGLMQITPGTWEELRQRYALGADPFDPCDNIFAGSAYLRELLDRYGDPGFLGAYNAGPGRYESYLNGTRPLPSETIDYMARVSARMGENTVQSPARAAPDPDAWRAGDLFVRAPEPVPESDGRPVVSTSAGEPRKTPARPDGPPRDGLFVPRTGVTR